MAQRSNCATLPGWLPCLSGAMAVMLAAIAATFVPNLAFAGQSARLVYSRTTEAAACSDETWTAPSGCTAPGLRPVRGILDEHRRGRASRRRGRPQARVYVIHDGNFSGWRRELSSASRDCTELIAAVALAMSIAIDPDALDRVEAPAASNEPASHDSAEITPDSGRGGGLDKPKGTDEAQSDAPSDAVTKKQPGAASPTARRWHAAKAPASREICDRTRCVRCDGPRTRSKSGAAADCSGKAL